MNLSSILLPLTVVLSLTAGCVPEGECTKVDADGSVSVILDCGKSEDNDDTAGIDSGDTSVDTDSGTDTDDTGETGITPVDADGDGFTADVDCDDENAAVNPDAIEICDSLDNDCDNLVDDEDDSVEGQSTWYADSDGDEYGDPDSTESACEAPTGYVANSTDCDDTDGDIHPYADESCTDTVDMNCDGSSGSEDLDGDGVIACEDCNDDPTTGGDVMYDGAEEICDGYDNDCDSGVDNDASDALTWYADTDGDEYGDPDSTESACEAPTGYVANSTDCDDANGDTNPVAAEVCDGIDNDCDGSSDEDLVFTDYYVDSDGDGYGAGTASSLCEDPGTGYSTESGDCDDTEVTAFPGGTEVCDSGNVDEDCDGIADGEDAVGATIWHHDSDGDGYGSADDTVTQCDAPDATWITTADADCDDSDPAVNVAATETCNGVDDDCDGGVDEEGAAGESTWYADNDSDGYGDLATSKSACDQPDGYEGNSDDCDDGDAGINPEAVEVCDGIDNDCDSSSDEDLVFTDYYVDADLDGYGDAFGTASSECEDPGTDFSISNDDCDDGDAGINPGAVDIASDGIDQDCDGTDATVTDSDGDGDPDSTDCNDTDATVYTGATETCDGVDEDCNGSTDEGLTATTYYVDSDGDGYGDSATGYVDCSSPGTGYSTVDGDCDDGDSGINPGEAEIEGDGIDQDCDGLETFYSEDFGVGSGSCTVGDFVRSDGGTIHQTSSCWILIQEAGSLTAPVTSIDVTLTGLSIGVDYTFTWNVGNQFETAGTDIVADVDRGTPDTGTFAYSDTGTLEVVWTADSTSVTARIWTTGDSYYDGVLTGLVVTQE